MSTDLMSLRSAVLGTLSKVSEKSFDRDLLSDGESHSVTATIAGTVDGKKFSFDVDAALTVGHATQRKTVSAPSAESMLAFVLGTVSMKQRDALVSVMKDCFDTNGELLVDLKHLELVDSLTESMSTVETKTVRGAVNVANASKSIALKISNSRVG